MSTMLQLIALVSLLGGRVSQTTMLGSPATQGASQRTYTVTIEKHPFFDSSQGTVYNIQSAMLIASPVCNLVGSILSYVSYQSYPTNLFQDPEMQPVGGGMGGRPYYDGGPQQPQSFSGQGRSLGGDPGRQ